MLLCNTNYEYYDIYVGRQYYHINTVDRTLKYKNDCGFKNFYDTIVSFTGSG